MTPHKLTYAIPTATLLVLIPAFVGLLVWDLHFQPSRESLVVYKANPFSAVKVEGRAAVVYNPVTKQVLFAKNEGEVLPIASLTKLMTAYIAAQKLPPDTIISTDDGNKWSLKNLIDFTLVTSFNNGAEHLAAAVGNNFPELMNEEAQDLGLFKTHYLNPTGLDINGTASTKSTALEVAELMGKILADNPSILSATKNDAIGVFNADGKEVAAVNTNEGIKTFPGLFASKTGYTGHAGGSLAVAFDAGLNQPLIVVVLGSSEEGRIRDAHTLALAAIDWTARYDD